MRWQNRRMCTHLLLQELQNYNLLLNNHRQESVGSHQKKITHIQGKRRSPGKMVGGAESCLEWDPIPLRARDTLRAQTCLVHQDPEAYTRTYPAWGTDSWRAQTEPCAPGPRRKEQWPHERLTQTCPWVSRSLQQRCGLVLACFRVGGIECRSACMEPFEGGPHCLHYLHHSLAPGK